MATSKKKTVVKTQTTTENTKAVSRDELMKQPGWSNVSSTNKVSTVNSGNA